MHGWQLLLTVLVACGVIDSCLQCNLCWVQLWTKSSPAPSQGRIAGSRLSSQPTPRTWTRTCAPLATRSAQHAHRLAGTDVTDVRG